MKKKITLNIKYACALLYYKVYSTKSVVWQVVSHVFKVKRSICLIRETWFTENDSFDWFYSEWNHFVILTSNHLTSKLGLQSSIVRLHQWFINSWLIFNDSSTFDANVHTQNIIKSKSVNSIDLLFISGISNWNFQCQCSMNNVHTLMNFICVIHNLYWYLIEQ